MKAQVLSFGLALPAVPASRTHTLMATIDGAPTALQLDRIASFDDGSLRFAVASVEVPGLDPGRAHRIAIGPAAPQAALPQASAPPVGTSSAPPFDVEIDVVIDHPQSTIVVIGDRNSRDPRNAFAVGDRIAIGLTGETHAIVVDADSAGPGADRLTRIAERLTDQINRHSRRFAAFRVDRDGGLELLRVTTRPGHHAAFQVEWSRDGAAPISSRVERPWKPRERVGARLAIADFDRGARRLLSGPLVTESTIRVAPTSADGRRHPHLTIAATLRCERGGGAALDLVFENTAAHVAVRRDYVYSATIAVNGAEHARAEDLNHVMQTRWRTRIPLTAATAPDIEFDAQALSRSRIVPHYDRDIAFDAQSAATIATAIARAGTGAMQSSIVTTRMGMPGGRLDIGTLPGWSAGLLLHPDPRLRRAVLALGDVSGHVPIHYRDRRSDRPLSLLDYPSLSLIENASAPSDALPPPEVRSHSAWIPATTHLPSLAFLPYVLTGEAFYLEELQHWALYNVLYGHVHERAGRGLVTNAHFLGTRGVAWALRELGRAVAMTPDDDPLKAELRAMLDANLADVAVKLRRNPLRFLPVPGTADTHIAPWMQDYLLLALAHLVDLGFDGAREPMNLLAEFTLGRFDQGSIAFWPWLGIQYYVKVRDRAGAALAADWDEYVRMNFPGDIAAHGVKSRQSFTAMDYAGMGYPVVARAAIAAYLDHAPPDRRERAARLYAFLRDEAPRSRQGMARDPTWAIVPRR